MRTIKNEIANLARLDLNDNITNIESDIYKH